MSIFTDTIGYDVSDLGFDKSLTKFLSQLQDGADDVPPELVNTFSGGTAPKTLISGELISSLEQQTGVVFSGKTDFDNTQTGYRLGVDTDDIIKFYIGNSTNYLNWTGTGLTIAGALQATSIDIPNSTTVNSFHADSSGNTWWGATTFASATARVANTGVAKFTNITKFGGDGSDGALSITSGTTSLSAGSADFLIKNYTSISITGTGVLDLTTPGANGTITVLKSQGDVTLTSSATPMIDVSAMGGAGGIAQVGGGGATGTAGTAGNSMTVQTNAPTGGTARGGTTPGDGGTAGAAIVYILTSAGKLLRVSCGSGGSAGGRDGTASPDAGSGGIGGGALIIECGGALNFTTASGISLAGANGTNASTKLSEDSTGIGGGGGGGGGVGAILYTTLTASSGTFIKTGGNGGTGSVGGDNAPTGAGCGGGAGGSNRYIGGVGGSGGASPGVGSTGATGEGTGGGTGGAGGAGGASKGGGGGGGGGSAGDSYVIQNLDFA